MTLHNLALHQRQITFLKELFRDLWTSQQQSSLQVYIYMWVSGGHSRGTLFNLTVYNLELNWRADNGGGLSHECRVYAKRSRTTADKNKNASVLEESSLFWSEIYELRLDRIEDEI